MVKYGCGLNNVGNEIKIRILRDKVGGWGLKCLGSKEFRVRIWFRLGIVGRLYFLVV